MSVDVFGVLLLAELGHAERRPVDVDVVEHVRVLIPPQPLVFPVESDGEVASEEVLGQVLVLDFPGVVVAEAVGRLAGGEKRYRVGKGIGLLELAVNFHAGGGEFIRLPIGSVFL